MLQSAGLRTVSRGALKQSSTQKQCYILPVSAVSAGTNSSNSSSRDSDRSNNIFNSVALNPSLGQQRRTMAENPNHIAKRITSTKSIQKITSSMKMVSAAKLKGDEQRLRAGKKFGQSFDRILPAGIHMDDINSGKETPDTPDKLLVTLLTSDRGLCGGVNSFSSKAARVRLNANANGKCFIVGAKGEPQMRRAHGKRIVGSVDEPWKTPINFAKTSAITSRLFKQGEFDQFDLIFNRYRSAIAYDTTVRPIKNLLNIYRSGETEGALPNGLGDYELEPEIIDEAVQNLTEFSLSVAIYGAAIDNAAAEQSARMTAMENASKNAEEMIEKLTIKYNRARQAKITTELIEIISGAESLNG